MGKIGVLRQLNSIVKQYKMILKYYVLFEDLHEGLSIVCIITT